VCWQSTRLYETQKLIRQ